MASRVLSPPRCASGRWQGETGSGWKVSRIRPDPGQCTRLAGGAVERSGEALDDLDDFFAPEAVVAGEFDEFAGPALPNGPVSPGAAAQALFMEARRRRPLDFAPVMRTRRS